MDRKILEYFPDVLKNVKEFKCLAASYQDEFDKLWDVKAEMADNCFISDMNVDCISRMEQQMEIANKASSSLEDRKLNVLVKNAQCPPYTMKELEKRMDTLCGRGCYSMWLSAENYKIWALLAVGIRDRLADVKALFEAMVPANMLIDVSLRYNYNSSVAGYTHSQLAAHSHTALREDKKFA